MQVSRLVWMLSVILALSACEASTPSQVYTGKIHVKEQMVTETMDARRVDPGRLDIVANNINKNSKGAVTVTVSYLTGDLVRPRVAEIQGASYKDALEARGITNVSVVTVPVTDAQYAGKAILAYRALTASTSKDCGRIPGYQGTDNLDAADHYQFGCDMQSAMSKMVADPSDLMGKAGTEDNDSRRAGATVETYASGKPNTPLKGFQASSIGIQ
mgnify:CR=1 FL=1